MHGSIVLDKKHIVVEGPIGVGKSSLSRKIVDRFGGRLFLEKPADNPFLERFYKSPERFRLATQLSFLMQRVSQFADLNGAIDSAGGATNDMLVADFMFEKDPIFAELTLAGEELELYRQVFDGLNVQTMKPDLIVYLQAPVKVLQSRIKKRNIGYEQKIDDDYLEKLSDAYTDYFHHYSSTPLLIVNAADFNPIDNDAHFEALMAQISRINAGKHFFNPLAL